jgi:hypothetical protein
MILWHSLPNTEVKHLLTEKGVEVLPVTVFNGKVVKTGCYPTTKEILKLLDLPETALPDDNSTVKTHKFIQKPRGGCGCGDGNCS